MPELPNGAHITLRDYIDLQIAMVRREMQAAERSNEIALNKASAATDYRLEAMNEFRAGLRDQTANYITRTEAEANQQLQAEKIESLQKIVYMGIGGLAVLQILLALFGPHFF